jgi:DNA repair protein RadC
MRGGSAVPAPVNWQFGETVTDLSPRLLAQHGGLRGLFRLDVAELSRIRGLGDAQSVRLIAALELGRRLAALSLEERPPIGSPEDVPNLLGIEKVALEQEQLRVVLLDTKHRILGTRIVYQGSVNQIQHRGANSALSGSA